MRDPGRTRQRLIAAAIEVVAKNGLEGCGVNAVAHAAGLDKVLIYRYFGGLAGLLVDAAQKPELWPSAEEIVGALGPQDRTSRDLATAVAHAIVAYARAIALRPAAIEALAFAGHRPNQFADELARRADAEGREVTRRAFRRCKAPAGTDVAAILAVLVAAVHHLVVLARRRKPLFGIAPATDQGRRRLEAALTALAIGALGTGRRDGAGPRGVPSAPIGLTSAACRAGPRDPG